MQPGDLAVQLPGLASGLASKAGTLHGLKLGEKAPRYNWLRRHANGGVDHTGKALGKWISDQLVVLVVSVVSMNPEWEVCLVVCGNDVGWLDVGRLKLDGTG